MKEQVNDVVFGRATDYQCCRCSRQRVSPNSIFPSSGTKNYVKYLTNIYRTEMAGIRSKWM
jgi:hypothetical protein